MLNEQAANAANTASRIHLGHLDGIRGLAALWVALEHVVTEVLSRADVAALPAVVTSVAKAFSLGHTPVDIFIVLSGYCLMIPVARSGRISGGLSGFIARRARRILPPYYASLGLFALLVLLVPALREGIGTHYDVHIPFIKLDVLVSHVLLLHNMNPSWIYQGNGVWWSVATEWQIYFLFPLLLIALRKGGWIACLFVALVLGALPRHISLGLGEACFHFLALFAMGMIASSISFSPSSSVRLRQLPWGVLASVLVAGFVAVKFNLVHVPRINEVILGDMLVGGATSAMLIFLVESVTKGAKPVALRLTSSQFAVWLGLMSYSLYLCHYPIEILTHAALLHHNIPIGAAFVVMLIVGVPLAIGLSYLFHVAFERPFLRPRPIPIAASVPTSSDEPRPVGVSAE
ncbi:MAG TPA: acyltransferase [Capsulimonadaceae bacterium]|jgi:peptidoglycan/LPS O-acetylase OafA/YrhL